MPKLILTQEQYDKLFDFAYEHDESGEEHFPGMTYEEGIKAVLNVIEGSSTVDEVTDSP